jgi:hypothetical protein
MLSIFKEKKTCSCCGRSLTIDNFTLYNDKTRKGVPVKYRRGKCKECYSKARKAYRNTPKQKAKAKEYSQREDVKKRVSAFYRTPKQAKKKREQERKRMQDPIQRAKRREYLRQYEKNRKATDKVYDMKKRVRRQILTTLARKGYTKKSRSYEILGTDYDSFIKYIEDQFVEGMSWDNRKIWDLDHIIPISFAQTEEDIIKLNHYTNFRPLWSIENMKRGNNINYKINWKL